MFNSCIATFSHTLAYLTENLTCLSYGFEVLIHKYLINFVCYDLLVDVSESFGIWVVLFVLLTSSLLLSVVILSYTAYNKAASVDVPTPQKQLTFSTFLKFSTLEKTKL